MAKTRASGKSPASAYTSDSDTSTSPRSFGLGSNPFDGSPRRPNAFRRSSTTACVTTPCSVPRTWRSCSAPSRRERADLEFVIQHAVAFEDEASQDAATLEHRGQPQRVVGPHSFEGQGALAA